MATIDVLSDAWVEEAFPAANHGDLVYLSLNGTTPNQRNSYIYFAPPFDLSSSISSAKLSFYLFGSWTGSQTVTAKRVTTAWGETTVNWSNKPTVTATNSGSVVVTGGVSGQLVQIDVTAMMGDIAAGGDYFGIELTISGANNRTIISTNNANANLRPYLDLSFSLPLEDPVNLEPDAAMAVSVQRPLLTWDFSTDDEDRIQSASQVQISTNGSLSAAGTFATSEYDSTMTSNTLASWDLSQQPYSFSLGTFTVTIASPAVFTFNSHGLVLGDQVRFTTTGALPTGLTVGTIYYVVSVTTNTFTVSTTLGGAAVNTSGTQSGTHTLFRYGVPNGATRYWHVRVQDDVGRTSDWSDVAQFSFQTQGTLAVSNPPSSGTVFETDPPVVLTLAGAAQDSVELILNQVGVTDPLETDDVMPADPNEDPAPPTDEYDADGSEGQDGKDDVNDLVAPPAELWRYPRTPNAAGTVTNIPEGFLQSGGTYSLTTRVWDATDRISLTAAPSYSEVTRTFVYARGSAVPPVNPLTVTKVPTASGPGVQLDWSYSPAPLFFRIRVNGKEEVHRLEASDALVSGSNYRYTYWSATPFQRNRFVVEAVNQFGGQKRASWANQRRYVTLRPIGIWLVDPSLDLAVKIHGMDVPDFSYREVGTTYDIIGSEVPVRIIDSLGGYSGSVSGFVLGAANRSRFKRLKGRSREKPLRLVVSDINIPIRLEEASVAPTADMPPGNRQYSVSFGFFQVGNISFAKGTK